MKTKLLLLLIGVTFILSSCSIAYRTGQTPDDVYYSPAPAQDVYVRSDNQSEKESYSYRNSDDNDDMSIRRGMRDSRYRSSVSLDLGYGYNPYAYNNLYNYNNGYLYNDVYYNPYLYKSYNPYYYNNYYASPYQSYYYYPQVYVSPKSRGTVTSAAGARKYNLRPYNTPGSNNSTEIRNTYRPSANNASSIRNVQAPPKSQNTSRGLGNTIRRVFTPDNSSRTRVYSSENTRNDNSSYSPSRSSSSGSSGSNGSSSSGSSAPVRTFRK